MRAMITFVCLAAACADPTMSSRIARLHAEQEAHDQALDRAEVDASRLSALWDDVAARYAAVEQEYARARRDHDMASYEAGHATADSGDAAGDWQRAQKLWRLYRTIVLAAVALEAGRYEGRSFSCDGMSTAAFRRLLMAQGMNLIGMDVDHIVPRSLGGPDHPMNYQVIDSSLNRSLGNRWDADKCLMAGQKQCGEALAVSRQCGTYDGPWF